MIRHGFFYWPDSLCCPLRSRSYSRYGGPEGQTGHAPKLGRGRSHTSSSHVIESISSFALESIFSCSFKVHRQPCPSACSILFFYADPSSWLCMSELFYLRSSSITRFAGADPGNSSKRGGGSGSSKRQMRRNFQTDKPKRLRGG